MAGVQDVRVTVTEDGAQVFTPLPLGLLDDDFASLHTIQFESDAGIRYAMQDLLVVVPDRGSLAVTAGAGVRPRRPPWERSAARYGSRWDVDADPRATPPDIGSSAPIHVSCRPRLRR